MGLNWGGRPSKYGEAGSNKRRPGMGASRILMFFRPVFPFARGYGSPYKIGVYAREKGRIVTALREGRRVLGFTGICRSRIPGVEHQDLDTAY